MKGAGAPRKSKRQYAKSGLWSLKASVRLLGGRALDRRTAVGQALEAWREELFRDLGGRDALSTQQVQLADLVVKSKLILDSIDVWLLRQPSLVNARKRALLPVVRERQGLADSLARLLGQLGLERVPPRAIGASELIRGEAQQAPTGRAQAPAVDPTATPVPQDTPADKLESEDA